MVAVAAPGKVAGAPKSLSGVQMERLGPDGAPAEPIGGPTEPIGVPTEPIGAQARSRIEHQRSKWSAGEAGGSEYEAPAEPNGEPANHQALGPFAFDTRVTVLTKESIFRTHAPFVLTRALNILEILT